MSTVEDVNATRTASRVAGDTGAKAVEESSITPRILPASSTAAGPGGPDTPGPALITPTARLALPAGAAHEAWLALRRTGVGGSDVAAILGLHRYKGPLHVWREKRGLNCDVDNEAMWWGRENEDLIARRFSLVTGLGVGPSPGTLAHVDNPMLLANIDRLVESSPGVLAPLECKNRSEYQAGDWDGDVPDEPALQAHWYVAVGGYSHAWVAACIGGNRLRYHRLERDDELIDHLVTFCSDWWARHVVGDQMPPPDGSKATTDLLAHLFEVTPGKTVEVDPVEALLLRERHHEVTAQLRALQTDLDEIDNQMKALAGDAEIATVDGQPAWTWKANGTFAHRKFAEAHPEIVAAHTTVAHVPNWTAIQTAHPEKYAAHRARRFLVPEKGPRP